MHKRMTILGKMGKDGQQQCLSAIPNKLAWRGAEIFTVEVGRTPLPGCLKERSTFSAVFTIHALTMTFMASMGPSEYIVIFSIELSARALPC